MVLFFRRSSFFSTVSTFTFRHNYPIDGAVNATCVDSVDANGKVIPTWADIVNRQNLGFEVMHERNAHNFPLDLAAAEQTSVALTAPTIG